MSASPPLHRPPSLELLLDYADGILDTATQNRIQTYLEQDENTRMVLEGILTFYQTHGHEREKLEAYLDGAEENIIQKLRQGQSASPDFGKKSNIRLMRITGIAAGISIALLAGYFLFFLPEDPNSLVTAYLETPYESSLLSRNVDHAAWIQPYLENKYEEAGVILSDIITSGKAEAEQYFFAGLCKLYQSPPDYPPAITFLEKVTETNNLYQQAARWYLSLAYYKTGDTETSKALLEDIVQLPGHYQHEEAEKLLEAF